MKKFTKIMNIIICFVLVFCVIQINNLENQKIELLKDQDKITILGLNDPSFETDYLFGDDKTLISNYLNILSKEDDNFTILLSHRPELFDIYVEYNINLILSGHAHGGQFPLPFVGGLIAPNQGLFPKYDSGLFTMNDTNMIVSKGIGNSIIPMRFNNRPEVIVIELKSY